MGSTANPLSAANLFNVDGMVAVVTGGGSGIGLMITRALAANGASKIFILGRRLPVLEEAAKSVIDSCSSSSSNSSSTAVVVPVQCDVTSPASLAAARDKISSQTSHMDLLVCNSGIGGPYGIRPGNETTLDEFVEANLSVPVEAWNQTFEVNTSAVWYTSMTFLKLLDAGNKKTGPEASSAKERKRQGCSQVVVVSSIAGFNKQNTGGFAYGQSKAAATHLVKQLSIALPRWDVRINAICPGLYPSEMSAPIMEKTGNGSNIPKDMIPLERSGDEQDMAGAILFLASRAGAYCNGAVIVTDGGRLGTFPSTF